MHLATLSGLGRREQHDVGESAELGDHGSGGRFRKVLGNLERLGDVETARDWPRLRQVGRSEAFRRDGQAGPIDVCAVKTLEIRDAELGPDGEPRAAPASDVDDAAWVGEIDHGRQQDAGRAHGGHVHPLEELVIVRVAHDQLRSSPMSALS